MDALFFMVGTEIKIRSSIGDVWISFEHPTHSLSVISTAAASTGGSSKVKGGCMHVSRDDQRHHVRMNGVMSISLDWVLRTASVFSETVQGNQHLG
jgi:hypothetical protein